MAASCFSSFVLLIPHGSSSGRPSSRGCRPCLRHTSSPPPSSPDRKVPMGLRGRSGSWAFDSCHEAIPCCSMWQARPPGGWPGLILSGEGQDRPGSLLTAPGYHPQATHPDHVGVCVHGNNSRHVNRKSNNRTHQAETSASLTGGGRQSRRRRIFLRC